MKSFLSFYKNWKTCKFFTFNLLFSSHILILTRWCSLLGIDTIDNSPLFRSGKFCNKAKSEQKKFDHKFYSQIRFCCLLIFQTLYVLLMNWFPIIWNLLESKVIAYYHWLIIQKLRLPCLRNSENIALLF